MGSKQSKPGDKARRRVAELYKELEEKRAQLMVCPTLEQPFESTLANFDTLLEIIAEIQSLKSSLSSRKSEIIPGMPSNVSRFIKGGKLVYHREKKSSVDGATSQYGCYGFMSQERSEMKLNFDMEFSVDEGGLKTLPTQVCTCPLTTSAKSIPWEGVTLGNKIGEGNFGEVFSGSFCASNIALVAASAQWGLPFKSGSLALAVALKANKSRDRADLEAFFGELYLQSTLMHPNVVTFLGATTDPTTGTPYGSFEYCCDGDVRGLLQRGAMSWGDIFRVMMDTCDGMAFLERYSVVHRDLATRNILVGRGKAKIADFGMAEVQGNAHQQDAEKPTKETLIPLRWVSPEVVLNRRWSNKSDVWAFGMVMLECFTAGAIPYVGMPNPAVYKALAQGQTPPIPKNVPAKLAVVMFDCWETNSDERCTFADLLCELAVVLRRDDLEPGVPPPTPQAVMQVGSAESSGSGYEYFHMGTDGYAKFLDVVQEDEEAGASNASERSKRADKPASLPKLAHGYVNCELMQQADGSWVYTDTDNTAMSTPVKPAGKLAADELPAFARYVTLELN